MGSHAVDLEEVKKGENFSLSANGKKNIFIVLGLGIIFTIIGIIMAMSGGGETANDHHALVNGTELLASASEGAHGNAHSSGFSWVTRLKADLWINNLFFLGISVIGVFFVAIHYIAFAGWSVGFKRIAEAISTFLPVMAVLMIGTFLWVNHDLFHWTHEYLYDKSSEHYDAIIDGKKGYLNFGFYMGRMLVFLLGWIGFMLMIRKNSLAEDMNGGLKYHTNLVRLAAGFLVFFGISSSMGAWDWIMSIDTHWFSTMFGWYTFASWWVTGLATITLTAIFLKEAGYLKHLVNENHFHDIGKFVFGFSIFWAYIFFSQFLLIYYANIPEEVVYYIERLNNPFYLKLFALILIMNFFFPFLFLMTRNAKRKTATLKIACISVVVGHWFDFFLMVTPGVLKENGNFGFLEIGLTLIYTAVFALWVGTWLSKANLVPKNHPMLEECVNHHI